MAYTHVAHDCKIGDHVILANAATLGGHVIVEDWAQVGALCPRCITSCASARTPSSEAARPSRKMSCHFQDLRRAQHARLRHEQRRPGTPRGFTKERLPQNPPRVQNFAGVEAEHDAGSCEAESRKSILEKTSRG